MKILQALFLFLLLTSCETTNTIEQITNKTSPPPITSQISKEKTGIDPTGLILQERFEPPNNYGRKKVTKPSFANYLRTLPLKPVGTTVKYYNGTTKTIPNVYEAVIDLPIGKKDLHQCADAIMRLKAEYHWQQKEYDQIHFNFTNGFRVDYSEWRKGRKMIIKGNKTYWDNSQQPATSYNDFWKYLELIFTYAGTSSLSKELKSIDLAEMEIGDILIQGGFPGHAVIVLDMAIHETTGEQVYILGQSYMPAQEIQVLKNNQEPSISPWYRLDPNNRIDTPEWTFNTTDLMRFR